MLLMDVLNPEHTVRSCIIFCVCYSVLSLDDKVKCVKRVSDNGGAWVYCAGRQDADSTNAQTSYRSLEPHQAACRCRSCSTQGMCHSPGLSHLLRKPVLLCLCQHSGQWPEALCFHCVRSCVHARVPNKHC